MTPLKVVETSPGKYSLLLNVGDAPAAEAAIEELGHEPNGYFWEGIARLVAAQETPRLEGRFGLDAEGSMFCAYGVDRAALEELGRRMAAVALDGERTRALVTEAKASGFEFDD